MFKRDHIKAIPEGRIGRWRLAIADAVRWPLKRFAWALEQHLLWRGSDLLRRAFETIRWPLERLVWVGERKLLWPLEERAAGRSQLSRAAGVVAAVATGVGLLAVLSTSGGGPGREQVAAPARTVVASAPPPAPAAAAAGPVLQGAPPSFSAPESTGVTATAGSTEAETDSGTAADGASGETGAAADGASGETGAAASGAKPVPAGPVAMRVARRFAEAFVFYEIGERQARALAVFEETATPSLASALGERPPRLPANSQVPQARVLNLVPGPRRGKAYTVSVSLLRVGVTSELRLEMKKANGAWLVTDVRG
jgi:hypothetical protein